MSDPQTRPYTIQRARGADAERVGPLFDAYRVFYRRDSDVPASVAFIRERLERDESAVFYAQHGDSALGFVQLYPIFASDLMRRLWLLNDLYVARDARRRGIARALMQASEEFARETYACGLTLSTANDNSTAQALYEQMGYMLDADFRYYVRWL